ncbi:MAG: hypothetical protein KIT83_12500 [Bryobacterales bacterium]|nr:hypothetical protein [Bryobacterales bacterium]
MQPAPYTPDDLASDDPAPELLIRDLKSAARKANHDEVTRLLRECESHWGRGAVYAEALSWAARAYFSKGHVEPAAQRASDAYALSEALVRSGNAGLDTSAGQAALTTAQGAAIEVTAQIAAGAGRADEAVRYLREMEERHQGQAFTARIRKNLLQLTLVGERSLPLVFDPLPGSRTMEDPIGQRPVLLFFWAHWCSDSRAQGRTLSRFFESLQGSELVLVAPTRLFGYITKGTPAEEAEETAHIVTVLDADYPWLRDIPRACVPFGRANFERYGASTVPTLALIDRHGAVCAYHPGVMKLETLQSLVAEAGG